MECEEGTKVIVIASMMYGPPKVLDISKHHPISRAFTQAQRLG